MSRFLVLITPMAGAVIFPLIVPFAIARLGVATGISIALLSAILWFIAMLRTSEMPH